MGESKASLNSDGCFTVPIAFAWKMSTSIILSAWWPITTWSKCTYSYLTIIQGSKAFKRYLKHAHGSTRLSVSYLQMPQKKIFAFISDFQSEKWKKRVGPELVGPVLSCLWLMWMYTMPMDQSSLIKFAWKWLPGDPRLSCSTGTCRPDFWAIPWG